MGKKRLVIPKEMQDSYDNFHFAPAVRDGRRLVCSGQVGTGPDGKLAPDPEQQFLQAFENVKTVLAEAGLGFENVIDMTTFHVGFAANIATFMKVKDQYVPEPYPAWTAIGVSELAFGALVEIKVTARVR
jgi:enamine deaminase RidA (YjgF/YER057c/UK114 family)